VALAEPPAIDVSRSHIRVVMQRSGNANRDNSKIQRIYGTLVSKHGADTFSIALTDGNEVIEFEFPNDTTACSPELLEKLAQDVPSESIEISPGKS